MESRQSLIRVLLIHLGAVLPEYGGTAPAIAVEKNAGMCYAFHESEGINMVLKLAIAEDDLKCAADLRSFVERYCREHGMELQLQVFPDGMELVEEYRPVWDVLLLDIEMPHLDGMEAAGRIRAADPAVIIIFITYMGKYAIRGYEVSALDFVLKPVNYSKLAMRLRHVEEIIRRREERFLLVSENGELFRVLTADIRYIEVANRHIYVHTADRVYVTNGVLSKLEQTLAGQPFARCSHSHLVNLRHVTSVQRDAVLVAGETVPLSRSRQKGFLQALSDYMGGGYR